MKNSLIWLLLGAALWIAIYLLAGSYSSVEWLQQPWQRGVYALAAVLAGASLVFVWRPFSSNRTLLPLISWSCAACGGMIFLLIAKEQQFTHDKMIADSLLEIRNQVAHKQTGPGITLPTSQTDRFERYQGQITDAELKMLREVDQKIRDSIEAAALRYQSTLQEHPFSGPDEWLRYTARAQIEEQRDLFILLNQESRNFLQSIERVEADYSAALESLELSEAARVIAVAEMERLRLSLELSGALEMRRLDVEMTAVVLQLLELLRLSWGAWTLNTAIGRIEFDNAAHEARFAQLLGQFISIRQMQDPQRP